MRLIIGYPIPLWEDIYIDNIDIFKSLSSLCVAIALTYALSPTAHHLITHQTLKTHTHSTPEPTLITIRYIGTQVQNKKWDENKSGVDDFIDFARLSQNQGVEIMHMQVSE